MSNEHRKREVARAFGLALRATRVETGISQDALSESATLIGPIPVLLSVGCAA